MFLQFPKIPSETHEESLEFVHFLVPQASCAAADTQAERTESIVVPHPFYTIAIFYAGFTEFPSTDILFIDSGVSAEAVAVL